MAGLCEGGNEPPGSVKTKSITSVLRLLRGITVHYTPKKTGRSFHSCHEIPSLQVRTGVGQDDHRAFRRQLEDKRPVVENNLLSGRQYIANEPPLSDTSDSEGRVNFH
ncbi:hypothetical protein ANN_12551 [Periplaneta americana]|uniref:Uncharacterized protein n=1 Tax=Periplaneta americana TaxID=6978 RepID=A0ABQ8TIA5_PERAM|nr:hypothetical protein ANN_12551 [Periplaneta americana]